MKHYKDQDGVQASLWWVYASVLFGFFLFAPACGSAGEVSLNGSDEYADEESFSDYEADLDEAQTDGDEAGLGGEIDAELRPNVRP